MTKVTVDEAGAHLSDLIRSALNGDEVILTEGNRDVVRLVPIVLRADVAPAPPGFGRDWMTHISDDFNAPMPELAEYMR